MTRPAAEAVAVPSVVGEAVAAMVHALAEAEVTSSEAAATDGQELQEALVATAAVAVARRSEERRVGKECV